MTKLELNKKYDLYLLSLEINDALGDTYSFIGLYKDKTKIIVRVKKDIKIEKGIIYHVIGEVKEYKTKEHLYADSIISLSDEEMSMDEKTRIENDLLNFYSIDYELCVKYIENAINSIENENLKLITKTMYNDYKDKFVEYPAANKFHHPYRHGLLFHTYNSLRVGLALSDIYPNVSKSLVASGLILHDLMKIKEINGFEGDYTLDGKLFGHITLGALEVEKYAIKLSLDECIEIKMLKHIILSHHSEAEYGSPKHPQIIEALIVHLSDAADAKIEPTIEALSNIKVGELTEGVYVNDKNKFYKHGVK